ncbi:hypothetical protein Plano_1023 [Planococcus sp. PAMC 21323]|uniref:hypothetical protein n=1 Tax=Planococcus sp. PAMC 21323 TaxID=1526927 RepID=UPI00056E1611|nr:hypothetical protein [Planococcus sp. PAMC 21323]AIY04988.1 hypothetical protein Plano_1023 [Planococcus sp. PAMC 21323]
MECEFLLVYTNGAQLMKKEYAEVFEYQLDTFLVYQESFNVMEGLSSIEEEILFFDEMKARILSKVFDESLPML